MWGGWDHGGDRAAGDLEHQDKGLCLPVIGLIVGPEEGGGAGAPLHKISMSTEGSASTAQRARARSTRRKRTTTVLRPLPCRATAGSALGSGQCPRSIPMIYERSMHWHHGSTTWAASALTAWASSFSKCTSLEQRGETRFLCRALAT